METSANIKKGFISGVFDGFHLGHRHILKEAKKYCDYLFVSINNDDYIRKVKGREPILRAHERRQLLTDSGLVDYVEIRADESPLKTIMRFKPDYIFVGSDYDISKVIGAEEVKQWGGKVIIIDRIKDDKGNDISTTNLLKKAPESA